MKRMVSDSKRKIYIAPDADVLGDVSIGDGSSIWYHAVIRAEDAPVTIGKESNVQDGCILHTDEGFPVAIGDRVTVGHGAILHGCSIGDGSLIGMGSIILNGAKIGTHCMIGAGTLIPQNMEVPDGHLAFGSPARVRRELREEELAELEADADTYLRFAEQHGARSGKGEEA